MYRITLYSDVVQLCHVRDKFKISVCLNLTLLPPLWCPKNTPFSDPGFKVDGRALGYVGQNPGSEKSCVIWDTLTSVHGNHTIQYPENPEYPVCIPRELGKPGIHARKMSGKPRLPVRKKNPRKPGVPGYFGFSGFSRYSGYFKYSGVFWIQEGVVAIDHYVPRQWSR